MKTYTIKACEFNWIEMQGTEVIDIAVGDSYAGCRCSICGADRYDKGHNKILCKNKDACCTSVLDKLEQGRKDAFLDKINSLIAEENAYLKQELQAAKDTARQLENDLQEMTKERNKWEDRYYRLQVKNIKDKQEE